MINFINYLVINPRDPTKRTNNSQFHMDIASSIQHSNRRNNDQTSKSELRK